MVTDRPDSIAEVIVIGGSNAVMCGALAARETVEHPLVPAPDQWHRESVDTRPNISGHHPNWRRRLGVPSSRRRAHLGAQRAVQPPFMVATTLAGGAEGLVTLSEHTASDIDIKQLARRIRVKERSGPTGRSIVDGGEIHIEGMGVLM